MSLICKIELYVETNIFDRIRRLMQILLYFVNNTKTWYSVCLLSKLERTIYVDMM